MQKVFVLDRNKQSFMPCSIQRAQQLLSTGKAAVFRLHPFTLILKNREKVGLQNIAVKMDPGSKGSGVSLVGNFEEGQEGMWAANLEHRGQTIKNSVFSRVSHRLARFFKEPSCLTIRNSNRNSLQRAIRGSLA